MSELHVHYCRMCNTKYDCTDDRPIDASLRNGPSDSVCFHHYAVPHAECPIVEKLEMPKVVVGGV